MSKKEILDQAVKLATEGWAMPSLEGISTKPSPEHWTNCGQDRLAWTIINRILEPGESSIGLASPLPDISYDVRSEAIPASAWIEVPAHRILVVSYAFFQTDFDKIGHNGEVLSQCQEGGIAFLVRKKDGRRFRAAKFVPRWECEEIAKSEVVAPVCLEEI